MSNFDVPAAIDLSSGHHNNVSAKTPRKLPIIGFDANSWTGAWMNRQEILSRLAPRGWPVIYSNGALSLWDRESSRWQDSDWISRFEYSDGVAVDRPGRLAPRWQSVDRWDRWFMRHHSRRLRNLAGDDIILYVFNPLYSDQIDYLQPKHVLFHVRDFYPGTGNWTSEDQYRLDRLCERADLITLAGEEMGDCIPASASPKVRLLPNSADPMAFFDLAALECPDDLASIPHPRIGFTGSVNPKVDLDALFDAALVRPDYQFVMIGPVEQPPGLRHGVHSDALQKCLSVPNIHWLGMKDRKDLPAYMVHMDANIMLYRSPTKRSSWINFINPLKMYSYLAAGKPVLSSNIPAVRRHANVIDIVEDASGWTTAIEHALAGGVGSPQQRRAVAFQNTWDSRVDQLETWLLALLTGKESGTSNVAVHSGKVPNGRPDRLVIRGR